MGNVLKQDKQDQIRALGQLGWSLRRIEESTGVRRETVSRYLKEAGISVRPPRKRRLCELDPDSKAASEAFADLERPRTPDLARPSACEEYREWIVEGLSRGRNMRAIWQDLVTDHGYSHSYESVKRFIRKIRGDVFKDAHPRIYTEPGEEAQVDYGTGPMVRDPTSRNYRRTRLFALTLGCSRKTIWLLSFRSSSKIWSELHEEAFRRLGGSPRVIVLDNLKEGVLKPDVFEPALNPLYKDVLAHYGVVAVPARVRHPDRKGKVESAIGYAQGTALKGKRFDSLEEAQADLDQWTERWADTRIHGTTKRQVAAMFAEELPHLQPLPSEPFRYYQYGTRSVHLDGCVEVAATYYSAPPGWISRRVNVQWNATWVRLLHPTTGELLRQHSVKPRGWHSIALEDEPKRTPPTTVKLLSRARTAGFSIGAVCDAIHRSQGEVGIRRIQGVLSLAKKHGTKCVNQACEVALEMGVPEYRFVRRWIERHPPQPLTLRQVDPLIRDLTQYRDVILRRTRTEDG